MARPLLVDGRNFLDPEALREAGFEYEGIGRAGEGAPAPTRRRVVQAIVLVGGEGTRLRPLTSDVPKPALTLVDRPFLAYMIEWLAGHGVTEVVLACGFLPDVLREALGEEEQAGVAHHATWPSPSRCGTAGAIRFAADALGERLDERFLALNGDVLTDLDLGALLRAHDERAAPATIGPAPGRGLLRLRPGRTRRRRRGARVPREDRRGGSRRDQRRRLRARALGARPDPGRARGLDRARGLPAAGRRGPRGPCCSTATGWTSAPPSATCRRAGTSSRAGSRRGCGRPRRGCSSAPAREVDAGAHGRAAGGGLARLHGRRRGRGRATRSCSTAARVGAGAERRRLDPRRRGHGRGRARSSTAPSSAGMKESRPVS